MFTGLKAIEQERILNVNKHYSILARFLVNDKGYNFSPSPPALLYIDISQLESQLGRDMPSISLRGGATCRQILKPQLNVTVSRSSVQNFESL